MSEFFNCTQFFCYSLTIIGRKKLIEILEGIGEVNTDLEDKIGIWKHAQC